MNGITLAKEKRERQPNWTEAEKQLLISLTKQHRTILDNKGSDGSTIRKKSEAWDDIAFKMRNGGYHRSKERLKQQYGRIKSAEAKRAKDALAGKMINETRNLGRIGFFEQMNKRNECNVKTSSMNSFDIYPGENGNDICIKIEKAISINECEDLSVPCEPLQMNSVPDSIIDTKTQKFEEIEVNVNEINEPTVEQPEANVRKRKRRKFPTVFLNNRTRIQSMRQLYLYRIAVERERLHSLRVQRKRERQLYRKDLRIQNLKLQILENLINHNRNNHINL